LGEVCRVAEESGTEGGDSASRKQKKREKKSEVCQGKKSSTSKGGELPLRKQATLWEERPREIRQQRERRKITGRDIMRSTKRKREEILSKRKNVLGTEKPLAGKGGVDPAGQQRKKCCRTVEPGGNWQKRGLYQKRKGFERGRSPFALKHS